MSDMISTELLKLSYGPNESVIVYVYDCEGMTSSHWPHVIFTVESIG